MDMYSTSKIIQRSGMKHPQRIVRALTTNAVKVLIVAWAKLCREDVGCCLCEWLLWFSDGPVRPFTPSPHYLHFFLYA